MAKKRIFKAGYPLSLASLRMIAKERVIGGVADYAEIQVIYFLGALRKKGYITIKKRVNLKKLYQKFLYNEL